ncbi:MAG TPA: prepilin-type N-terminal cleavage/methylation domain-containing protein [Candidatus Sulfotelmatobacter sp.]|nr:prepilin-type N-terminal cleavage/methylation domain-containing protein [Candidatus Sulfotelmatobacter sp.]
MMRSANQFIETLLATSPAASSTRRRGGKRPRKLRLYNGFTLLELMIVISIMMILMAVAVPLYQQHVIQAREAVLRQNLFQLDSLIEQYRLDKGQSPQSLDDLVTAGYLPKLPVDPMTMKADWTTDPEDPNNAVDPQQTGIARAHSSSAGTALNGEAYSSW